MELNKITTSIFTIIVDMLISLEHGITYCDKDFIIVIYDVHKKEIGEIKKLIEGYKVSFTVKEHQVKKNEDLISLYIQFNSDYSVSEIRKIFSFMP